MYDWTSIVNRTTIAAMVPAAPPPLETLTCLRRYLRRKAG
jgi:hypothetical protein